MKFIPYYKKTITSTSPSDLVLSHLNKLVHYHRASNFPTKPGFVGGEVRSNKFELYMTTDRRTRKPFPVVAVGRVDKDGNWTVNFTCHLLQLLYVILVFGLMTFVAIKTVLWIGIPLILACYGLCLRQFDIDSQALESLIKRELASI